MERNYGLSDEILQRILTHIPFEIYVTDEDMRILYISDTSVENYSLTPEQMIGHNHREFVGTYWWATVLPYTYTEKRDMCIEQMTITGKKIISSTAPVFDENGHIRMVVSVVQEKLDRIDASKGTGQVPGIVARSEQMNTLLRQAQRAAGSSVPLLIQGPSGTGKTLLARYIHEHSGRAGRTFLSINCAAIPENLLESELFGYAPYAFTGASAQGKVGLIELAAGGTLFLDEIGELSPLLQSKLLDVIENRRFLPVGGDSMRQVDVRIISATNRNLARMVEERAFREDLYWRLNVVPLRVPALAERREDILPLANYYLKRYNEKHKANKYFSPAVMDLLFDYSFPGNVRQLKNLVERVCCTSANHLQISADDLPPFVTSRACSPTAPRTMDEQLREYEGEYIRAMYEHCGSIRALADAINISRSKAARLVKKHVSDCFQS